MQRVNLSNCPQITSEILLLSLIPSLNLTDAKGKKIIGKFIMNSGHSIRDQYAFPQKLLNTLTFEVVQELDISKCRRLLIEQAVDYFSQAFPSLKILKAAYLLNIRTTSFLQSLEKCPLVCEIDLTVDITPLIPASVTVLSSSSAVVPPKPENTSGLKKQALETMPFHEPRPPLSNLTKLTLEGRTDVSGRMFFW